MISPRIQDLFDEGNWLEWRAQAERFGAVKLTEMVTTEESRLEFLEGARLLRFDERPRAGDDGRGPSPMQLMVVDVLTAGKFMNAIFEPRRSTKTTAVQALLLGRCAYRPDYQVGWTMFTTGAKAGERFRKDIVGHLERLYPVAKDAPFKINVGKGTEHVYFKETGAYLNVYTPNGEGFRSGGFDVAFGDEAAEADIEQGEDVERAVIPTMDTKIGAQFILAGTGQKWRTGNLLWKALHDPDAAVAWHGIPETQNPADLVSWEPDEPHPIRGTTGGRMRELIELHHPGVGFTTPVEAVKRSFDRWPLEDFLIEYGGQFGFEGAADTVIAPALYAAARTSDPFPALFPARVSVALKVHHLGSAASLAIAWDYDEPGDLVTDALALDGAAPEAPARQAVALWHWQSGIQGLPAEVLMRLRRQKVPLVYDKRGYTESVVEKQIAVATPRPIVKPTKPADIPQSTVRFLRGLDDGTLVVFPHAELDRAAGAAVRQAFGNFGTFRFGAPKHDPDADVTPLEAAALALHYLDYAPTAKSPTDMFKFKENTK